MSGFFSTPRPELFLAELVKPHIFVFVVMSKPWRCMLIYMETPWRQHLEPGEQKVRANTIISKLNTHPKLLANQHSAQTLVSGKPKSGNSVPPMERMFSCIHVKQQNKKRTHDDAAQSWFLWIRGVPPWILELVLQQTLKLWLHAKTNLFRYVCSLTRGRTNVFLNINHTKAPWEVKVSQKAMVEATDYKKKTVLWTEAQITSLTFMKECVIRCISSQSFGLCLHQNVVCKR